MIRGVKYLGSVITLLRMGIRSNTLIFQGIFPFIFLGLSKNKRISY